MQPERDLLLRHSERQCERELKGRADYDKFLCTPAVFVCSCGRRWEHVCDEAEGCGWECVLVRPARGNESLGTAEMEAA